VLKANSYRREGAAGDLVGADGLGKVLGLLDEAYGLVGIFFFERGHPAVSELRLGFHIHVDGGDFEFVFFRRALSSLVVNLVGIDNLYPVKAFYRKTSARTCRPDRAAGYTRETGPWFWTGPGDDGHFEHACLLCEIRMVQKCIYLMLKQPENDLGRRRDVGLRSARR